MANAAADGLHRSQTLHFLETRSFSSHLPSPRLRHPMPEVAESQCHAPLTVFYGGRVHIIDGVSKEQVNALSLFLASSSNDNKSRHQIAPDLGYGQIFVEPRDKAATTNVNQQTFGRPEEYGRRRLRNGYGNDRSYGTDQQGLGGRINSAMNPVQMKRKGKDVVVVACRRASLARFLQRRSRLTLSAP